MLGHGGVPWPFVRRSRFVKELERQGEAYRQNVSAADHKRWEAERELQLQADQFVQTVTQLSGWREGATNVFVDTHTGAPPQHFDMKIVPDGHRMSHTFVFRISDTMMMHMMKTLDPVSAQLLVRTVTERLTKEAIIHMYEEGAKI